MLLLPCKDRVPFLLLDELLLSLHLNDLGLCLTGFLDFLALRLAKVLGFPSLLETVLMKHLLAESHSVVDIGLFLFFGLEVQQFGNELLSGFSVSSLTYVVA